MSPGNIDLTSTDFPTKDAEGKSPDTGIFGVFVDAFFSVNSNHCLKITNTDMLQKRGFFSEVRKMSISLFSSLKKGAFRPSATIGSHCGFMLSNDPAIKVAGSPKAHRG